MAPMLMPPVRRKTKAAPDCRALVPPGKSLGIKTFNRNAYIHGLALRLAGK